MSDEGLPDEMCWRRALNYVTLTAARFQFIRLLVLPVVLHDRGVSGRVKLRFPNRYQSRLFPMSSGRILLSRPSLTRPWGLRKRPLRQRSLTI